MRQDRETPQEKFYHDTIYHTLTSILSLSKGIEEYKNSKRGAIPKKNLALVPETPKGGNGKSDAKKRRTNEMCSI